MKKYEKKAAEATKQAEAPAAPKAEGANLEAISSILRPAGSTDIAPGGVFKATPEQATKLVGNGSARRTNKPVSTDKELGAFQAAHINKQREAEEARLGEIRRSNS